jgi:hypothetical protein
MLWSVLMLLEMASLGSLAQPAAGATVAPPHASSDLIYGDGAGPACALTSEHLESWVRIPDLRGGTVYQEKQADPEMPSQHIWWDPADGAERIVVRADTGTAVRPYAVSGSADNPILWFTVGVRGATPTEYEVGLHRLELLSGEGRLVVAGIGGFEIQPLLMTFSEAGLLVSNSDSTGSWFELYDLEGSPVAWPANPHPLSDYTMKTVYGSLSEDGTYLASIEAEDGATWRIVVRDTASGEEVSSRLLPHQIWRVLHADTSAAGFSFLVETAEGKTACISVPQPAHANGD